MNRTISPAGLRRAASRFGVNRMNYPAGNAAPADAPLVDEVRALPMDLRATDRLYAEGVDGAMRDITASVEGRRVSVPEGTCLVCADASGRTRWRDAAPAMLAPSGDIGGRVGDTRTWVDVPRLKLRLVGYCQGYVLGTEGWPDITDAPYPETTPTSETAPWIANPRSVSVTVGGIPGSAQCGTYNVGFPFDAETQTRPGVLVVRYNNFTAASFAVRLDPATNIATVDITNPPVIALRLVGLPPYSRVFNGATDITTAATSTGLGGWSRYGGNDQGSWVIGVPTTLASVTIQYPNGQRATLPLPGTHTGGIKVVTVPAAPLAQRVNVRLNFPAQRAARIFAIASTGGVGDDVTVTPLANGTNATWDGNAWVFGLPVGVGEIQIRYEDGTTQRLAVPLVGAGETAIVNVPAPERAGMGEGGGGPIRTNPTQRIVVRARGLLPGSTILYNGQDVTGTALSDGTPAGWVPGSATPVWRFSLPQAAAGRTITVRYPGTGGERTLAVGPGASPDGAFDVTVPPPDSPVRANTIDLRIEGVLEGDAVFVGDAEATGWTRADNRPALYEAASRARTIGIPAATTQVRVRQTDGVVRTFAVPPPVNGVSTLSIPFDPARLGAGGEGGGGGLVTGSRRIRVFLMDLPGAVSTGSVLRVTSDGRDITDQPLPTGVAASRSPGRTGRGVTEMPTATFGFDYTPNTPQSLTVTVGDPRWPNLDETRTFPVRAADVAADPSDPLHSVLRLSWEAGVPVAGSGGGTPRTGGLSGVRVWMIDPPAGTYAVAKDAAGLERRLDGPTTELAAVAAMGEAAQGRERVWVTEGVLPDGAPMTGSGQTPWVTSSVRVVLPNGESLPVSLAPVPTDGILRVQLSSYAGPRPTQSSAGGGGHLATAPAEGGGGLLWLGALALAGGTGFYFYNKAAKRG